MTKNIALLYGGRSGEHEVSCVSARFLYETIRAAGYNTLPVYIDPKGIWHLQETVDTKPENQIKNSCVLHKEVTALLKTARTTIPVDFIFPIIHGTTGEDGKLQGFLDFLEIPYAGSGVLSSALCMDKYMARKIFDEHGIPQVKYDRIDRYDWENGSADILQKIERDYKWPVFIKPSNMGSSVGVSKVDSRETLTPAIELAFQYDTQLLCEAGHPVREIEVSILGNYPDYRVSIAGEITPLHSFYSYEAKYLDQKGAELAIPANISPEQMNEIQKMAKDAFRAVKGDGFARIDFFIDKATGKVYLNEINTLPGFTPISMFPMLWEKSGLKHGELIRTIITLGEEKFKEKQSLKTVRR